MGRNITDKAILATVLLHCGAAVAADVSTEPRVDLRIEQNDNLNLDPDPGSDSDVLGYIAEIDVLVGIATPRGETSLRPRVRLQDYPDRDNFERFEGFLDMLSRYEWQRSTFEFNGHLSQQDLYNSDTAGGSFDPLDPDGGDPDSGEIVIGQTRSEIGLRPTFEHRITERAGFGLDAEFLATRYDADNGASTRTDYDYGVLNSYVTWALSPSSDLNFGAYASRYETTEEIERTDAIGGRFGYSYRWSETDGLEAFINYERNDIERFDQVLPFNEQTSNFGGTLTAYRKLEVSEWQFSIGRDFIPTGNQGKSVSDRFRIQYDRLLSQRLSFRGAARYDSRSSLTDDVGTGNDRDYARVDLSLKWLMTRTWYIGAGYSYIWEDQEQATSDAANNKFFINIGYQGLSRQSLSDGRP